MIPQGFGEIAEKLRRSTVQILDDRRSGQGAGSGVISSSDGTIVTNAHVARGAKVRVQLWDGRALPAEVTARDDRMDLARVNVDASSLPALDWRGAVPLRSGEVVLAVGNPLGFVGALSTGVIHAVGAVAGLGKRAWVQASIRLAPGNSGGPLADAEGRVVGINTMVTSQGIALAIPAQAVANFLKSGGLASLGVVVQPVEIAPGRTALLVIRVIPQSPAEAASLFPGDLLIAADGSVFGSVDELGDAIDQARNGILKLRFLRGDRRNPREVSISLAKQPRREAA